MPKLDSWTDSIPLSALMLVSFFAGCLTATKLEELEWETLTAGLLAVIAGAFALQAAKIQTRHQEEIISKQEEKEAKRNKINFLQEMDIFNSELRNCCDSLRRNIQLAQTENEEFGKLVSKMALESLPTTMPIKPLTLDEETSIKYNQIAFQFSHLKRNVEVAYRWKIITEVDKRFVESTIYLASDLVSRCDNFPKSNMVFTHTMKDNSAAF